MWRIQQNHYSGRYLDGSAGQETHSCRDHGSRKSKLGSQVIIGQIGLHGRALLKAISRAMRAGCRSSRFPRRTRPHDNAPAFFAHVHGLLQACLPWSSSAARPQPLRQAWVPIALLSSNGRIGRRFVGCAAIQLSPDFRSGQGARSPASLGCAKWSLNAPVVENGIGVLYGTPGPRQRHRTQALHVSTA